MIKHLICMVTEKVEYFYLEELKVAKTIISPVLPNITKVARPLFPSSHGFFPVECVA